VWSQRSLRHALLEELRLSSNDPGQLRFAEGEFSKVGRRCDSLRLDNTSHRTHDQPQVRTPHVDLLSTTLEIGFRLVTPGGDQQALRLNHTFHHDRMLETVFLGDDDNIIADAVSVWTVVDDQAPFGSCVRYLAERTGRHKPFSPRLRRAIIQVIEHIWPSEMNISGPETVRLLNRLHADVDDIVERDVWVELLLGVICLPAGLENLSSH
jgi:hypothetical protein